jgi:hypothetical protein
MHVQDFTQRPNAEIVLSEWYGIRRNLDEEEMENTRLHFRKGIEKPVCHEFPVGESSPSGSLRSTKSGTTRSDKRDISSSLNKVGKYCLVSDYAAHLRTVLKAGTESRGYYPFLTTRFSFITSFSSSFLFTYLCNFVMYW